MNAQTLSKHELFDQIESCIARMIDILKNRPRFQALASASATTTSPPTTAASPLPTTVTKPPPSTVAEPPPKPATPLVTRSPKPAPVPVLRVFSPPPRQQHNQNSQ
ncbi:hypothetical protein Hanom_Chr07g00594271 [Helianthus anomalus]